nr:hypothetical protein [uncultured Lachnoanaerobaculum sp.]
MKKRRLSQNKEAIRGILIIIVFIVGLVFLRDMLVKRGVSITMLTELDYINAAEYYMQKKYGEKFEGEYVYEDSVYVHPKSKPEWHVVVDFESEGGLTSFHDNYVGYLKKEELEKYIYELVKPIYGECKVYTQPFGISLDDSWDKNIDIITYVKSANYDTFIFTYKENNEKEIDFNRVCDIFLKEELQSNGILVTYITQQDFDNIEEKKIDYIFNSDSYYYRVDVMYSKNTKKSFSDISILKGNDNYGK